MTNILARVGCAFLFALPCGAALAADVLVPQPPVPAAVAPVRTYDIVLEVGAGGQVRPAYEGAKAYEFAPTGFVTVHQLWLPWFGTVRDGRPKDGWSFGPSFRYLSGRESNDYAQLRGLNDIDAAFEVGARVAYTFGMFRPSVAIRQGFGGHSGIVGEAAFDAVLYPTAATEFTIGPRVSFANGEYMRTYFGVSPVESANSGLLVYDAGSGIKGMGVELTGRYRFNEKWALASSFSYEKLLGDAKDSPIVRTGDDDQFSAKLGITYTFAQKLFAN